MIPARCTILACLALVACQSPVPRRPNVVLILADDMGYGDLHSQNPRSTIATPNLDRLAAQGMRFTDAHTPSSVCTPTRYGLLTGRYCWRSRLKRGVLNGYSSRLIEPGRRTLADLLQVAGYHTGIVGKWHLGLGWHKRGGKQVDFGQPVADGPNALGFASSYIIPASLDFPPYVYIRDGRVTTTAMVQQARQAFPAYLRQGPRAEDLLLEEALDHLTGQAVRYIAEHAAADQPFFLYFPLTAPHKPALPHPRFRGLSGLGPYGDFVMQVDWTVGQVMAALATAGVEQDTLVIYTSDNGSYMHCYDAARRRDHAEDATVQGYRPEHHRANGPWRGTKADIWEAGHRVPFLLRWPGRVAAGAECEQTICLTDVLASCAELVGMPLADDVGEDSHSFLALATGAASRSTRPAVVHHSASGMFAIRSGRWKLVAGNGSGGRQKPRGRPFGRPFQLFDLQADPGESQDLIQTEPEVAERLTALLKRFCDEGRSVRVPR